MEIKGVCPIAPAVYTDQGEVDVEDYKRCCAKLIELGAQTMTLFGIAGEYYKFDESEERKLMTATAEVCHRNGAGCIISNTKHSTISAIRSGGFFPAVKVPSAYSFPSRKLRH